MNNLSLLSTSNTSNASVISSTPPTTKVILVRHGRTNYNEQGRYQGSSDESVLTEKGYQDAYKTGLALEQFDFDAIYTSPLTRVQQTAQAIAAAFRAIDKSLPPILIEPLLTEICMSNWEGLYYQEVKEKFPQAYRCWQETPHLFSHDRTFYPVLELFQQARNFWHSILDKHRGQTILITAHGGTNRALIATAIGLDPKYYHSLQQTNSGISCLEFPDRSDVGRLNYLNVTNHLGEKLPKLKAGKTGWRWLLLSERVEREALDLSFLPQIANQNLVDLILTDHTENSANLADNLLEEQQKIIHLSIAQDRFLSSWQKTILARQKSADKSDRTSLFTGLIIASDRLLSQLIQQTLNAKIALDINNHLAVVHYPQTNCQSILQGILPINRNLSLYSRR